jgi:DNA polymerase
MTDRAATDGPDGWDGCGVVACQRCPDLVASRSRIVNGVGPLDAPLLLVGEAPGADEDAAGEPFVGRSGGVLDDALRDTEIGRDRVRITNCVRCRPPENRDPTAEERERCRSHLDREAAAVDPALVVALGKVPAEHLLGRDVAVTDEAGSVETAPVGGARRDVLICVHPAATLYDPSQRDTLDDALATAVRAVGLDADGDDQSRLDAF